MTVFMISFGDRLGKSMTNIGCTEKLKEEHRRTSKFLASNGKN